MYEKTRIGTAERLLENSYESFYWLGFIAADGYIIDNKRLRVTLAIKDLEHIKKLSNFLGNLNIKIDKNKATLAISHKEIINKICDKYGFKPNKTINPINLDSFKGLRNKLSFIAGFIDGDGCIKNLHKRPDFNLRIKCHATWLNVLNKIDKIITGRNSAIINNQGYASLHIGNSIQLKKLKNVLLKLNIPLLERKWNVINENYISRLEIFEKRLKIIKRMIKKNKKYSDMIKETGLSPSGLSELLRREGLR